MYASSTTHGRLNGAERTPKASRSWRALLSAVLVIAAALVPLSAGPAVADSTSADFVYSDSGNGTAIITGYQGSATDVVIPATIGGLTVVEVGVDALRGKGLTSVSFPDSLRVIGGFAFANNALTEVVLPDGLEELRYGAFEENLLTKLTFLGSVGEVGNGVTALNYHLAEVVFGGSVGSLGIHAVGGSSLARVHFAAAPPTSIRGIGPDGGPSLPTGRTDFAVTYDCAFHASSYAGGFTGPTWKGYRTLPADTPTVSFDMGGFGAQIPDQVLACGDVVAAAPTEPTSEGLTFTGWFTDSDRSTEFNFATELADDVTLYAGWEIATYTVTFDSAGGEVIEAGIVEHGDQVVEPTPTRDGHSFTGWFTDAELTEEYDFDAEVTDDLTLYAGWDVNAVAELVLDVASTEVDEGGTVTITAVGLDEYGFELRDVTEEITLSSSVGTDVIDGNQVTFVSASEHVITATHVEGVTAELAITVIPAVVEDEPVDEVDELVEAEEESVEPIANKSDDLTGSRAQSQESGGLALTGSALAVPAGLAGLMLLVVGGLLVVRRRVA